ncbi:MAG: hypothetical protein ACNA7I_06780 [Candidatus Methanoperedens sp.]
MNEHTAAAQTISVGSIIREELPGHAAFLELFHNHGLAGKYKKRQKENDSCC